MEEQLISFSTAKLAREKGFDEVQKRVYYDGELDFLTFDDTQEGILIENIYSAPTQSLLQKWLREKHELWIVVYHYKTGLHSVSISNASDNSLSVELFGETFKTYELALEAGLQEALKETRYKPLKPLL